MSSDSDISKTHSEYVFLKRIKEEQKKPAHSIVSDYKILLALGFAAGLPFFPHQISEFREVETFPLLLIAISALFNLCRTFVCLFATYFSSEVLPSMSLVITLGIFNFCSLLASWTFFFKRCAILHAMQATINSVQQINSSKFKTSWNINFFLLMHTVGVLSISVAVFYISFWDAPDEFMNVPVMVLWYEVDEQYYGDLMTAVMASTAVTYSLSAFSCEIVVLISSTLYFHLADTILNFGMKLKKRFQQKAFSHDSLAANLVMFQKIVSLNQEINSAVSIGVFFFYGATIACFFKSVSLALTYGTMFLDLFILDVLAFMFAVTTFFTMTFSGSRVKDKSRELRQCSIECSRIIIASNPDGKIATYSGLMVEAIRAVEFVVSGGGMFTISKDFILTIAGILMTYGVLIFQVDE